jgi:N6-adenosine-specific RNA methylase IME4
MTEGLRSILSLSSDSLRGAEPAVLDKKIPKFEWVDPKTLYVEEAYQRGISVQDRSTGKNGRWPIFPVMPGKTRITGTFQGGGGLRESTRGRVPPDGFAEMRKNLPGAPSRPPSLLDGLPPNHFGAVLADPPWKFSSNSESKPGRNARRHYKTMTIKEIAALPVADHVADDAALFLWITGPLFVLGAHLPVMKAWGFKPSGIGFVWIKLNPKAASLFFIKTDLATGGGFTTRKNAEFCLIGKRGRSVRRDAAVHEVIIEPRREHSRKPDETHRRIERYCAGPYLELFGRQERSSWIVVGDQVGKFGCDVA